MTEGALSPLRVTKATKERVHLTPEQMFGNRRWVMDEDGRVREVYGVAAAAPEGIVVRSLAGSLTLTDQSPVSVESVLEAARAEWPNLTLVRVLRIKDGVRVKDDEAIYAGDVVVACDWEPDDA